MNASWPFAKLSATADKLTLHVKLLGTYTFFPEQVFRIEPQMGFPVLGSGIRIRHGGVSYPETIIFWCMGNPASVLEAIRNAGFNASSPSLHNAMTNAVHVPRPDSEGDTQE